MTIKDEFEEERKACRDSFYHHGKLFDGKFIPSEKDRRMTASRHTGFLGTGVYMVSDPERLETRLVLDKDRDLIFICDPFKNPFLLKSEKGLDELMDLNRLVKDAVWDDESYNKLLRTFKEVEEKNLAFIRDKELLDVIGKRSKLLLTNIDWNKAIDSEALKIAIKEARKEKDNPERPQPINHYLKAIGYDGIKVPKGSGLDTTKFGSVYFCEKACKIGKFVEIIK